MIKVQSVETKASFWFVGDLNIYDEELLGPPITTLYGRTARSFPSSSG